MEITTTTKVDVKAKALYEDGDVKLSLIGTGDYDAGKRTFSVSVEDYASPDTWEAFNQAFEALINEGKEELVKRLEAGRAEVVTAATRVGEM